MDPGKIDYASKADIWIKPKPGLDGALALGMIKVIIEEELYDKNYLDRFSSGFEKLKEHISTFSLEDVERETWVPVLRLSRQPGCLDEIVRVFSVSETPLRERFQRSKLPGPL